MSNTPVISEILLVSSPYLFESIIYSFGFLLLSLGVLVFGVFFLTRNFPHLKKWPRTSGKITLSNLEVHKELIGGREVMMRTAQIEYTYTVSDVSYKGNDVSANKDTISFDGDNVNVVSESDNLKVTIGNSSSSPARASRIVAKYYQGKNVAVYYNPADPSQALLERRTSLGVYFPLVLGIGMTVIALLELWYLWLFRDTYGAL